jgi:hypothetical protein
MHSILTYVILVGIPLAGLMGILKIGEGLDAPIPIAGRWVAVEGESRAAWEPGCRKPPEVEEADQAPTDVRIEQSGARADVTWSAVRAEDFRVTLHGDSVEGKLELESGRNCRGGVLTLRGVVRQVDSRVRITGELRPEKPEDCPGCKPIPIDWRRRR